MIPEDNLQYRDRPQYPMADFIQSNNPRTPNMSKPVLGVHQERERDVGTVYVPAFQRQFWAKLKAQDLDVIYLRGFFDRRAEARDSNDWLYLGLKDFGVEINGVLNADVARLIAYLSRISQPGDQEAITVEMANVALRAWAEVWRASNYTAAVPDAGPADDGHIFYTWNKNEHYLEMEVFQDGRREFFYRNRNTEELWGQDCLAEDPIPDDLLRKLQLFR